MQRASKALAVAIWPLLGTRQLQSRDPIILAPCTRKTKWCWCSHLDLCAMTTPRSSIGSVAAFAGLRPHERTSGATELQAVDILRANSWLHQSSRLSVPSSPMFNRDALRS